jgi:nitrogen regulatory protein P-II 1
VKLVTAIIRASSLDPVKSALAIFGARGMTVSQILWADPDANRLRVFRGRSRSTPLHPRLRLELLTSTEEADDLASVIASVVASRESGAPAPWIGPVDVVVRIRTGERNTAAL